MKYLCIDGDWLYRLSAYEKQRLSHYSELALARGDIQEIRQAQSGFNFRFWIGINEPLVEIVKSELQRWLGRDLKVDEFYTPSPTDVVKVKSL